MKRILLILALAAPCVTATAVRAQGHVHTPGMQHPAGAQQPAAAAGAAPRLAGQDAYGAIGEIVRILESDPNTDWSRVDLERLRQHLIDMDEVTLRSSVAQTPVPGGARMDVTGDGPTVGAIRRMARAHGGQLAGTPDYQARVEEIPGGARLTVTAKRSGDRRTEAKIRGLGFIGLLTDGDHHGPHHLAMARGGMAGHGH